MFLVIFLAGSIVPAQAWQFAFDEYGDMWWNNNEGWYQPTNGQGLLGSDPTNTFLTEEVLIFTFSGRPSGFPVTPNGYFDLRIKDPNNTITSDVLRFYQPLSPSTAPVQMIFYSNPDSSVEPADLGQDAWNSLLNALYIPNGQADVIENIDGTFFWHSPYTNFDFFGFSEGVTAVPEPATMLRLGSGLIGLVGYGRKKFFKK